ncbi:CG2875 [Drosophila busckii]|uniref:CG2875 n=1 Tax=Drosophila busckii TaxID=30019 RepID=A0A0M4F9W8_DROBS|nr:nucleolar complex protein 4 homolog B [Drosophila busckii]ALC49425.1 CG2875 [Drosophila busckii]
MKQKAAAKRAAATQDNEEEQTAKRVKVPQELQQKANALLNDKTLDTKALKRIISQIQSSDEDAGELNVLEVIFKNLLKRNCVYSAEQLKPNPNAKCEALYNETWTLLLSRLAGADKEQASMALKVCMQLIIAEAKFVHESEWPTARLRDVLGAFVKSETSPAVGLAAFGKYARCLDVLQLSYQLLPEVAPARFVDQPTAAFNYLAIINTLDLGKTVLAAEQYHLGAGSEEQPSFTYERTRKFLNKTWKGIMRSSSGLDEKLHRQVLVVLLERILPHLTNPILLTDFLMDSLHQFDGPIALLALQGIFTLMQQQNITYPDVYTKLYNMFYPRMFYNKYKARLFYLADIFLTSTHLPENLVAAFVKRLSRLALKSPTEDAIIMIRFVCNLLLRHTGLQRLICATPAASAEEVSDPYDETQADPVKTNALSSSLWELALLQKHAVPEVANAAQFVTKSLPTMEFDLGPLLESKESDLFDGEVKKQAKQFMLAYERPTNLALPKDDIVTKYWNIL